MDVIDLTREDSHPTATIDLTRESDDFSDPSILDEVERNNPELRLVVLVNIINSSTNAHDFVQKLKVDDDDFSFTNLASLKRCCPNKRVGAVVLAAVLKISATRTITVGIVKTVVQEVGRCTFSIGDMAGIPDITSRINNKLSSTLISGEVLELAKKLDRDLPSWILETYKWILEGLWRPQLVAMVRLWLKKFPDAFGNDLAEVKAIVDSLPYSQANLETVLASIDSAFDSNNSKTTTPPSAEINTEQLLEEAISLRLARCAAGGATRIALDGKNDKGQQIAAVEMGETRILDGRNEKGQQIAAVEMGKISMARDGTNEKGQQIAAMEMGKVEDLSKQGLANRNQEEDVANKRRAKQVIVQKKYRDKLKKEAAMKEAAI
ncbi:hypothetical protein ScalyP_jg6550 [Parmales sp. scaly parma]|nr:hypothetical protein ScalyP_jg6550 [Parmales sp. scaly parma]